MCNWGCCCNIYFHFPAAAACLNIVESTRTMHSKCVCRALLRFISSQCPIKNLHWMQLQYMFHSVHATARCDHWTQPFNKYASSSALYPLLFIVLVFWCIPMFLRHFQHRIHSLTLYQQARCQNFTFHHQPCLVKGNWIRIRSSLFLNLIFFFSSNLQISAGDSLENFNFSKLFHHTFQTFQFIFSTRSFT